MLPFQVLAFFVFCFSFLLTVAITGALADIHQSFFIALFLFILVINIFMYIFEKKYTLSIAILTLVWIWVGSIVSSFQLHDIESKEHFLIPYFVSHNITIKGKVVSLYKQTEHDNTYLLETETLNEKEVPKGMRFQATFNKNLDVSEGNILSFSSQIYPIRWEKSSVTYFTSQWIYFRAFPTSFTPNGQYSPFFLFQKIWELRTHLITRMNDFFPHDEAIFLAGILLWARESINRDILNSFNNAGLTHIIAVSGFNITILLFFFWALVSYFPSFIKIIALSSVIAFFVLLVGFSPSVLRAALMGIITYIVTLSGRQINIYALISLVLWGFVVYNPLSLVYDISLQLSFLAVLWVIMFYPFFEKMLFFLPKFFAVRESIVITLSATITTLPIMLLNFWKFSLVAPMANLLVGWTIPLAMFGGSFTIVSSYFFDSLTKVSAFVTYLFLRYDIEIVRVFWTLKWSTFEFDIWNFSGFFIVFYFLSLWFLYLFFRLKSL